MAIAKIPAGIRGLEEVLKSRGRAYSSRIHAFRITHNGIEVENGGKEGDHVE